MALVDQKVPPTINLDNMDEGAKEIGIDLVPNTARDVNIEYALCNSFGFGGTNGSLIFKKI
jgi:3-oxoacyl-[acyl-carrier-protein] synthase II